MLFVGQKGGASATRSARSGHHGGSSYPFDLRTIRANNRAVRQGMFTAFQALLKLEKSLEKQWARKALFGEGAGDFQSRSAT